MNNFEHSHNQAVYSIYDIARLSSLAAASLWRHLSHMSAPCFPCLSPRSLSSALSWKPVEMSHGSECEGCVVSVSNVLLLKRSIDGEGSGASGCGKIENLILVVRVDLCTLLAETSPLDWPCSIVPSSMR